MVPVSQKAITFGIVYSGFRCAYIFTRKFDKKVLSRYYQVGVYYYFFQHPKCFFNCSLNFTLVTALWISSEIRVSDFCSLTELSELSIQTYIVIRHHRQIGPIGFCDLQLKPQKQLTNISLKAMLSINTFASILRWYYSVHLRPLKAIAPFVCAHPPCASWAYGREDGKDFSTGAYGAAGGGVMFKGLYLL